MVVVSPNDPAQKIKSNGNDQYVDELPIVDLSLERSEVSRLIVKASETYGFFKVINHGVDQETISRMEKLSRNFFTRPAAEKQRVGPANPFGYGSRNIGFNGDMGEVEYLLLHATPTFISHKSSSISNDPSKFCTVVSCYIEEVRDLSCEILDLMAEGLRVPSFSRMIRAIDSDSVFRLNHYPPASDLVSNRGKFTDRATSKVGFGEHTDPQILTVLRSNGVDGLQVCISEGRWVPVSPDPTAFCVNVGDLLQAMTNGRFVSVRHRAITNGYKSRMSIAYFAAPQLIARIDPLPGLVTAAEPRLYKTFTWADYKKATYSLRLEDSRLNLFSTARNDIHEDTLS